MHLYLLYRWQSHWRLGFGVIAAIFLSAVGVAQNSGTAWVQHGPTINGTVNGSIQEMSGDSTTLNSGAAITADLLAPGTPTLRLNGGNINFGGSIVGTGSSTPTGYNVTLNSNSQLGHLRTRIDPVTLPTVPAPPTPAGTRSVSINNAGQSPGDFATLRNLTLNSNVGNVAVPASVYGDFTANGGSGFTLGVSGATTASVYTFQHLTLNSNAQINIIGPVVITVANSVAINGSVAGNSTHPEWLTFKIYNGGITLNGSTVLYGYVVAPGGTTTINSQTQLVGGLVADRLTVNSGGTLRLIAPVANQPPVVSLNAPADHATYIAPASFALVAAANDADGSIAKVEFYVGSTKLGEVASAPYQWAVTGLGAGTYAFTARAVDNANAAADSAPVTVTVGNNQPPSVALTAPVDGSNFIAPAGFTLSASASDADGVVSRVEFYEGAALIGTTNAAPFQHSVSSLGVGNYTFSARAYDDRNASADSVPINISVVSPPNHPPSVTLTSPATGTQFYAPATVNLVANASDSDGTIAQVEFFQGATNLGATTISPYQFAVSNLSAGSYTFTARATDNNAATTDSAPITISVVGANQPPTVVLTAPAAGSIFNFPATINLAATAHDPDGSIAKVEFYQGTTKLGEALQNPFTFAWSGMLPGSYALSAKAYDNQGAFALSAASPITVQAALPFVTDFESSEGYVAGPLAGQGSWTVSGNATLTTTDSNAGAQALTLPAASPFGQVSQDFAAYSGEAVVFVDFFAKPVAAADASSDPFARAQGAAVSFVRNGAQGELQVFNGNGAGGGAWEATGVLLPIGATGGATTWHRVTLREDFQAKKWDLYVDGVMKAADLGFADNTATTFVSLTFSGSTADVTRIDSLFVGFDNPLFIDADKDGIDDAWEIAHGLNPAINDRDADPDGDGVANIREYLAGTDPQRNDRPSTLALAIVSGDNQSAFAGQFDSQPLVVAVTDAATGAPLPNQSVVFTASSGGGLIGLSASDQSPASSQSILTGPDGKATVYFQQPATPQVTSSISAAIGATQITFHSTCVDGAALDTIYKTDFEASEGYTVGSLDLQHGWTVDAGTVNVSTDDHAAGSAAVGLLAGESASQATYSVESDTQKTVVFVDLNFKPTTGADMFSSSGFASEEAPVIFKPVGDQAEVWFYDGTIGDWSNTGAKIPLDANGRAARWFRFTIRLDYKAHVWDLYIDGKLVLADAGFDDTQADHFTFFTIWGATAGTAWFDSLYIGYDNPLFVDRDRDGMEDAWEVAHGLDASVDDSELDPDHDGLTNIQEFRFGTDPHNRDSDGNGVSDGVQTGVDADGNGLPDAWEILHFGHTGVDPTADPDGDGFTNSQEYQRGTDPNDYYEGHLPIVRSLLSADGHLGPGGLFAMAVTAADGTPLVNAPVTFEIAQGTSRVALSPGGPPVSGPVTARSGPDGIARVYVQPAQP